MLLLILISIYISEIFFPPSPCMSYSPFIPFEWLGQPKIDLLYTVSFGRGPASHQAQQPEPIEWPYFKKYMSSPSL